MADDKISQDQIEELLRQAQVAAGMNVAPAASAAKPTASPASTSQPATETTAASAPAVSASRAATATLAPPVTSSRANSSNVGDDISFLLQQAEQAIASVDQPVEKSMAGISPFAFRDLVGAPASGEKATLELLQDVDLDLRIELGRTEMFLEDILKLKRGSVVPLDKLAGDPVDIYANGRLIARGEVLVLNDNFCVRVAELLTGDDLG